ncbi:class I SAM-dependent methyltransferase [Consotaella aegiceratis]|uniref:class I SAM-dependent methyltransferase n=1 Tax=Consotaella aegiceratis TaxID=3097961 RepID=UPI002F428BCB
MSDLARRIAQRIRREGPVPLDTYWNLALYDRREGYYTSHMPFGRTGDFITAPEVSQMFGELLGAWMVAAWHGLGTPAPFVFAEIGPGRGTLMADMLRTVRQIDPAFLRAARITLVEVSDRLAEVQRTTLERFDLPVARVRTLAELEAGPLLLVGNELFDALAIRQFVHDGEGWQERRITVADDESFAFTACPLHPEDRSLIEDLSGALPAPAPGTILELAPARWRLAQATADRLRTSGGAALFIDYGHPAPAYGDTLQALRGHQTAEPLNDPGQADLTSHVEFGTLARIFAAAGLAVAPLAEQGQFLFDLGLRERASTLGTGQSKAEQAAIVAAAERLAGTGPGQMGRIFKVLAAATRPLPLPPFPAALHD